MTQNICINFFTFPERKVKSIFVPEILLDKNNRSVEVYYDLNKDRVVLMNKLIEECYLDLEHNTIKTFNPEIDIFLIGQSFFTLSTKLTFYCLSSLTKYDLSLNTQRCILLLLKESSELKRMFKQKYLDFYEKWKRTYKKEGNEY